MIGTKCNSLLLVDAHSSRAVWPVALPPQPPRPTPSLQAHSNLESCGIHCLATSPDGGLLATGGDNPNDCQIWSVGDSDCAWDTPPQLRPLTTLVVSLLRAVGLHTACCCELPPAAVACGEPAVSYGHR